ncbi:MAG: hypothetical protein KIT73_00285 [Burkholderiales bacterium]|nr:hypothetical protein [Burkholderiales bacterium]
MDATFDQDRGPVSLRVWLVRGVLIVGAIVSVAALAWMGKTLLSTPSAPSRQVAKIAILPDTPPPPPPKELKKPDPPKEEQKTMQVEQPKPQEAPAPPSEQLKMEGPAGDGPSAFAAGEVKNEYKGGEIGASIGDNRARFSAYGRHVEQQIREALERRSVRGANLRLFLWLAPDGSVQRYELTGADAAAESTRAVEAAFADLRRVRDAPPADMPMPIGLQISMR